MSMIYNSWVLTVLALLVFAVSIIGIPIFLRNWRSRIAYFVDREPVETEADKEAKRQVKLIEKRETELGFITKTVAAIEFFSFAF